MSDRILPARIVPTLGVALSLLAAGSFLAPRCPASEDEQETLWRVARFLDADADYQIDSEELNEAQRLAGAIGQLDLQAGDSDLDGVLSPEELFSTLLAALAGPGEEEEAEEAEDAAAEAALANALGLPLLLEGLAGQDDYAAEIARLREAVEDLHDEDATVSYLVTHASSYPRLYPVVRVWATRYPTKPHLRRHFAPRRPHPARPAVRPTKPRPKPAAKPGPKPPKPSKPPRPGRP